MAYTSNRNEEEQIRKRVRQILNSKISNPAYDGDGYNGMEDRIHEIFNQINEEKKGVRPDLYRRNPSYTMGYGVLDEMMGGAKRRKKTKSRKKVSTGKKTSKTNPWIQFLKMWRKRNPHIKGRNAMGMASQEYRVMCKGM